MKWKEEEWLGAQLRDWAERGLISQKQASEIRQYRQGKRQGGLSLFAILAGLGALSIVLGVILVVSYNWEKIPALPRQAAFLAILAAAAIGRARLEGRKGPAQALDLAWMLLPLAGIGLWGQIYQLSGDAFKPLFVTLLLGLPIIWISRGPAAVFGHAALLAVAMFVGGGDRGTWVSLRGLEFPRALAPLALGLLLWAGGLFQARRLGGPQTRLLLWMAFLGWVWQLGMVGTPFRLDEHILFVSSAALCAIYWAGSRLMDAEGPEFNLRGIFMAALLLYIQSFAWRWHSHSGFSQSAASSAYALALAVGGVLALCLHDFERLCGNAARAWGLRALLAAPLLCGLLFMGEMGRPLAAFLANLSLAGLAVGLMMWGVEMGSTKAINRGIALMGLLMLTRFIDYFGTLFDSGIAFIGAGVLFLVLATLLNRGRQSLLDKAAAASAPKKDANPKIKGGAK